MKNTSRSIGKRLPAATLALTMTAAVLAGLLAGCSSKAEKATKGPTTYYEGPVKSRYAPRATNR